VFNLVNKRYLFLIISLIVIVPGFISFLFKGMNVGIDFAGGANVEIRPSQQMTVEQVTNLLGPLHLENLQIVTGNETAIPSNHVAWITLTPRVDSTASATIQNRLKNGYTTPATKSKKSQTFSGYGSQLAVQFFDVSVSGKPVTLVTVSNFKTGLASSDKTNIENLLTGLTTTNVTTTGAPVVTPTPTTVPTATPTPGKGTPTATATPKPTATATPKATATPTATATPSSSLPTFKVKVESVQIGTTTQTMTLLTSTQINADELNTVQTALLKGNLYAYVITNSSISPSIAAQTTSRAILAVIAAAVFILLYVWFAFRKVPKPWRYGACAIIALLHDVLVVLGVFSILGWAANVQIDTLFITALLTVVGFSVHDTIVVFDRIRENMQRRTVETFEQVVNASLVQTMARSLNTSLTVLFTLSALTLFGGDSIRTFTLALLVGIFSGTYSSIFNASMLLVIWEKGELGLWRLQRGRGRTPDGRPVRERDLARTRG
jgi:preprotein translocase SecF subunit